MGYSKENTGALFKNDRKKSTKHPDYTGKVNVGGQDFRLAGWIKQAQSGKSFMSLSVTIDDKGDRHVTDDDIAAGSF